MGTYFLIIKGRLRVAEENINTKKENKFISTKVQIVISNKTLQLGYWSDLKTLYVFKVTEVWKYRRRQTILDSTRK